VPERYGRGTEHLSEEIHAHAAQLRRIALSRKKTDRRDAYWIARALASGIYPQPV
jgi:hypothetical protein